MSDRDARLAVIVPTLDEEASIGATLDRLRTMTGVDAIVVVDGGSTDDTVRRARDRGVRVIEAAETGRGPQLAAGAEATGAEADIYWFVHADTLVPIDGPARLREACARPGTVGGHFRIRFDGPSRAAAFLTWLYPRLALLDLRYGDSAYFVRRDVYERVGGFDRRRAIFEDLDLLRRLRRHGRFVRLDAEVVTSSRRFEGRFFPAVLFRWGLMQVVYWLGLAPTRMYPAVRER